MTINEFNTKVKDMNDKFENEYLCKGVPSHVFIQAYENHIGEVKELVNDYMRKAI